MCLRCVYACGRAEARRDARKTDARGAGGSDVGSAARGGNYATVDERATLACGDQRTAALRRLRSGRTDRGFATRARETRRDLPAPAHVTCFSFSVDGTGA